jgi:hypothetical protein
MSLGIELSQQVDCQQVVDIAKHACDAILAVYNTEVTTSLLQLAGVCVLSPNVPLLISATIQSWASNRHAAQVRDGLLHACCHA